MILFISINILEPSQLDPSSKPAAEQNTREDTREAKEQGRKLINIYLFLGIDLLLDNFKYRKEFLDKKDTKLLSSLDTHFPDVFQQPSQVFLFFFFLPLQFHLLNFFSPQSDNPESYCLD